MSGEAVNKKAVARHFSDAASHYDAWATAQARIAQGLVSRLPDGLRPRRVVDLGCGTGLLSALLLTRFPEAAFIGLDMAQGMVEACRRRWSGLARAQFLVGDAENPAFCPIAADLITLGCVIQWFARPEETLRRWIDALAPGGAIACAILLRGSFGELDAAYRRALGSPFPGLKLWDAATAPELARRAGLAIARLDEENVATEYESARAALRSFRRIGATIEGQPGYRRLAPGQVRRLLDVYGRGNGAPEKITVTYRVQYLVASKL